MKLSLKQKALVQTVGMFAIAFAISALIMFAIVNFSTTLLLNFLAISMFVYCGYSFYSITLSRLQAQAERNKSSKNDN